MFQYAAARALADRIGAELVIDTRAFANYTLRPYALERFAVRARKATTDELARWPTWLRTPSRIAQRLGVGTRWYSELRFGYDSNWNTFSDDLLLEGYFQSEKYFSEIAPVLRTDFLPIRPLSHVSRAIAEAAKESESVALHVRRGDYVSNPKTLRIHGVCSPRYYEHAINLMRSKLARPRFFIFSNDMVWAKANLALGNDATFVDGNTEDPELDVFLMAQCRHHIIANSSFSWWGAWLCNYQDANIIAPAPWFDSNDLTDRDLIPSSWTRLSKDG